MVNVIRRNPSKRSGFTLVELLVVITIIGILMGLLIPAVQAARETARRNQCGTQINNLAKAAIQEEMNKRQYPGWVQSYGSFAGGVDPSDPNGATAPSHAKVGTWVVALLPYLEAQPTFEIWTQDKYPVIGADGFTSTAAPNLPIMQCQSSSSIEGSRGRNSYVANNGMSHMGLPSGLTMNFADTMNRANGVFNSKWGGDSGPIVRADDIKDGLGNTVLFSENLQAQPWSQLNSGDETPTIEALLSGDPAEIGPLTRLNRFAQGFVWHYRDPQSLGTPASTPPDAAMKINGAGSGDLFGLVMNDGSTGSGNITAPIYARPSSAHNGGVNMGFADGSSRFVMQTIDYRVYQALMTPRGKSSNVPFSEYVLEGDSL